MSFDETVAATAFAACAGGVEFTIQCDGYIVIFSNKIQLSTSWFVIEFSFRQTEKHVATCMMNARQAGWHTHNVYRENTHSIH